ncbi:endonuclease/exonuclease/phosphatase family protein [Mycolicibacterium baixiangningiae]|uniref:endonuclease/exonuclease/phosphatase family protein n=1 Tax=Mycolicibacterium baixiangningiae TaxID=2761578 RepID=UPI001E4D197B|nr:endonuclease/exonuclease/phosphatase family protein [Mycolicibacterium baixiangningiae]
MLPLPNIVALLVSVGAPFTSLVALLGLALSMVGRRIILSIAAMAVLAATVAVQVPWYYFGSPPPVGQHTDLRVLSSNLRKGRADAASFVDLAKERADVITVSELTPEEARRFSRAGLESTFPYAVLSPAPGGGGIGLWSRFPLATVSPPKRRDTTIAAAKIQIPGVRYDLVVASVHVTSPLSVGIDIFDRWRRGITDLKASMDGFVETAGAGAVVVAGDFNSTPDMRQFRDLLTNGYRDAVEQTGAGPGPTFPSYPWFRPLITIDHVLTRNAAASSLRTLDIKGSDHRAILATIEVPLDPTAS